MYPYIKLLSTIVKSRFKPNLKLDDTYSIKFRVGITDIDLFMELNHARYLSLMEMARWDFVSRAGLLGIMKKNKWGIAMGAVNIRYRRRIPLFARFEITTKMICHDGRWVYLLQEFHRENKIHASALVKGGIISKEGLVNAPVVAKVMGQDNWGNEVPEWVNAWIEAEGKRPWPKS